MKLKRTVVLLLMLAMVAALLQFGRAQAASTIWIKRAVCINDTQIVIEFSEPVAVNLEKSSPGPWICMRVLYPDNNTVTGGPRTDNCLQVSGSWDFVDDTRDRIIWTMDIGSLYETNETIRSIVNFEGDMWKWGLYQVKLYIEEIPYDKDNPGGDLNDNITSLDGTRHLATNVEFFQPNWSATVANITFDSKYVLYKDEEFETEPFGGITLGAPVAAPSESSESASEPVEPTSGNNIGLIIGFCVGGAVVAAGVVALVCLRARKRKAQ